jgi:hypothetical protein
MEYSIEAWIKTFIQDRNLVCLRDRNNKLLAVSYSVDGLKWATDALGRSLYYKDAILKHNGVHPYWFCKHQLTPIKTNVISKFIPQNHKSAKLHKAEVGGCDKALRMLYATK